MKKHVTWFSKVRLQGTFLGLYNDVIDSYIHLLVHKALSFKDDLISENRKYMEYKIFNCGRPEEPAILISSLL